MCSETPERWRVTFSDGEQVELVSATCDEARLDALLVRWVRCGDCPDILRVSAVRDDAKGGG